MKKDKHVRHNPVHKHSAQQNRAATHSDRKKAAKRGKLKHKGRDWS